MAEPYRENTRRRLVSLDDVRVATPCSTGWGEMKGDGRVRFCGRCNKSVFNIEGMSRADAEDLVHEHLETKKEICIRLYKREDGKVITADCPVGVRAKIVRRLQQVAIAGGLLALAALLALKYFGPKVQAAGSMGAMNVLPER